MNIFWELVGFGIMLFLSFAGVALLAWATKGIKGGDPFAGTLLDDKPLPWADTKVTYKAAPATTGTFTVEPKKRGRKPKESK